MGTMPMTSPCDNIPINSHKEPLYGSRLLPQVVDELAQSDPGRIYATMPLSSDLTQGFRDVTMRQMSQAVDKCAYWMEHNVGPSTTFETLTYIGLSDLRYAIVFLAAVKCGYKLLVPSIRNSTWMNISLLQQTACTKLLYSIEVSDKVHDLQRNKKDLRILAVQSLSDMLQDNSKHYPYDLAFSDVRLDPVLILHSSGSTGPPKPIQMNHATLAVADNDRNLPTVPGRKNQSYALWNFKGSGGRFYAAFPPFHLAGIVALVVLPIFSTTATVVLGPTDRPPTGHLASEIMKHYEDIRAIFCPPSILEQLVVEPGGLEQAKGLDFFLYAGGPLSTSTGNLLAQVTDVCQFYGSTETGAVSALVPRREDWASLEFHPSFRVDMQPCEDDAYEMVLHRDPQLEGFSSLFCSFPDIEEWHTRDLFRPHPTKPNLWRFHGRTDDIIVLSNGEKFNPSPSEARITGHHLLSGAIMVGLAKFQPALIVELREGINLPAETVIGDVWPTVQQANAQAPGHARITRSMIAVTTRKRFERAGKGTVIRRLTTEKFQPEIEALYSQATAQGRGHGPVLAAANELSAIQVYVRASINLSFPIPDLKENDDLYVLGLDSLKTVEIAGLLKAGIEASDTSWLSAQAVYLNPTIQALSNLIHKSLNPQGISGQKEQHDDQEEPRITRMASLVHKYTANLPQLPPMKNPHLNPSKLNVVLTGSTGSLGTHLLHSVLTDPAIRKIHCLNRSPNARSRQLETLTDLHLSPNPNLNLSEKVSFLQATNYGDKRLGLPDAQFDELTETVDFIIHNAWKVDFNQSLPSFEPVHIAGVRNLIDWSIRSPRHPQIIFLSSVSSVGNWHRQCPPDESVVPEMHSSNHAAAQGMGYAESKHVAECILNAASEKSGVPVSVLRVGQIAGPVSDGAGGGGSGGEVWNRDEWFPSLMKTSYSLGCIPNYIPDADWIPVDTLAAIVTDILHSASKAGETTSSTIYNIVNPSTTPWTSLLDTVLNHFNHPHSQPQTQLQTQKPIQPIELHDWIKMLEHINQNDTEELTLKPAAKILGFFREVEEEQRRRMDGGGDNSNEGKARKGVVVKYSTANAIKASKTMAELEPIKSSRNELPASATDLPQVLIKPIHWLYSFIPQTDQRPRVIPDLVPVDLRILMFLTEREIQRTSSAFDDESLDAVPQRLRKRLELFRGSVESYIRQGQMTLKEMYHVRPQTPGTGLVASFYPLEQDIAELQGT